MKLHEYVVFQSCKEALIWGKKISILNSKRKFPFSTGKKKKNPTQGPNASTAQQKISSSFSSKPLQSIPLMWTQSENLNFEDSHSSFSIATYVTNCLKKLY